MAEDKELTALLQVSSSALSDFRHGRVGLSPLSKMLLLRALGWTSLDDVIAVIVSDEEAARQARAVSRRARKLNQRVAEESPVTTPS